jgi:hypothetical protein
VTATLADRLNAAADIIEERGHAHGDLEDARGRVCVVGALNVALTGCATDWQDDTDELIKLVEAGPLHGAGVIEWNDRHRGGRFVHYKRDAVRLLRKAARKAAEQ